MVTDDGRGFGFNQMSIFDDDDGRLPRDAIPVAPPPHSDERPPNLRRVWFRNFKGFRDTEIEFGAFNVLVGVNNAGKSSVLQGIDLLFTLLAVHAEGDTLSSAGRLVSDDILPVAEIRDLFFMRQTRAANVYVVASIGAEFSDSSRVEFGIRHLFGGVNSKVVEVHGVDGDRLRSLLARPAIWVPSSVGIVREEEYRTPARRLALVSGGRHNEVLRNQLVELAQKKPEQFERLQGILSERFDARLDRVEFDGVTDQFMHSEYQGSRGQQHDLYSAGSGVAQVVQLLAFVLARDAGTVLLDEPDAHLHSSMQRTVIDVLERLAVEAGTQVLLATHSKEIINFVDPSRLILVDPEERNTGPVTSEITPMTILQTLGTIDNIDAVALIRHRRCMFVEGDTDVVVMDRFASKLGIPVFSGDSRVVILSVGGADRFGHVEQLDVFEELVGAPVESLEIRDRDGRSDENRQRLVDSFPRDLHVLERDSIESYLIAPEVISRVVDGIYAERGREGPPSSADVEALVLGLTEDLRRETEDHVSQRFLDDAWRFDEERPGVAVANSEARQIVEDSWSDLESRLRVVPGKSLLSRIRREIQDRFGVNFGNERLAEEFRVAEIPRELADILRRVEALLD